MKFLVCGLGSIGQRHVRMLRRVLGDGAEIACWRSRGLDVVIDDRLQATFGRSPEEHYGLRRHDSLKAALAERPDAVFVANPISMHVETALAAARSGCHVFVEKPLGAALDGADELLDAVAAKGLVAAVGYQLRFHPALAAIREELRNGAIGRVAAAQIHFGEWLPGMHPYEDYRESHAARADQGGGVILCLSHEIDYACWLFGVPRRVHCVGGHLSDLELRGVEDTAQIVLECEVDGRIAPVAVHLDFLQRPPRRFCHIVGERGQIHWDYYENVVRIHEAGAPARELAFPGFERNDMFLAQADNFIAGLRGAAAPRCPLEEGLATLKVCLAARRAMAEGRPVAVA